MPKAYWVVTYRAVKNSEAWQAYAKLAALRWPPPAENSSFATSPPNPMRPE
jgi:hypothetical protein